MKKKSNARILILPYIIGGALFIIGGIRFYFRDDLVGAIIYGVAGVLAWLGAYPHFKTLLMTRRDGQTDQC